MIGWRELVRFARQRHRVFGALAQPIVFWLLFGAGLRSTFQLPAGGESPTFLEYFLPGTVILIVLFTAIFATISIIEDRREGFLQAVLVAPVPRWSIVLGKVIGTTIVSLIHAAVFLALAFFLPVSLTAPGILAATPLIALTAASLASLGSALAWRMDSSQGFHAIMNVVLLPLWLLSGAFFPIPVWNGTSLASQSLLHVCMRLDPLTYAVAGVRQLLYGVSPPASTWEPPLWVCWTISVAFAAAMFVAACREANRRTVIDAL
jgi:ABC-2 type transport system permease protein